MLKQDCIIKDEFISKNDMSKTQKNRALTFNDTNSIAIRNSTLILNDTIFLYNSTV